MKRSLIIACACLTFIGCDKSEDAAPQAAEASKPALIKPLPAGQEPQFAGGEEKPEVKIEYDTKIETVGEKSTVYWTAKVPTGGWTMTLDQKPLVEERNTLWWVRVSATLEAPASGDMVTQGFQTLTGKFEADKKINRVEFSVRRKVKGEKYDFQPMYSIVKTGPDRVTDADKAK